MWITLIVLLMIVSVYIGEWWWKRRRRRQLLQFIEGELKDITLKSREMRDEEWHHFIGKVVEKRGGITKDGPSL